MADKPVKPVKPVKKPPVARPRSAGARLRRAVLDRYELDVREQRVLDLACAQADDVAALEAAVKRDGVMIVGAAGQRRLNAAVTELRGARLALARLLGELALPSDEDEAPETFAQRRARKAVNTRWARRDNVRRIRDGKAS